MSIQIKKRFILRNQICLFLVLGAIFIGSNIYASNTINDVYMLSNSMAMATEVPAPSTPPTPSKAELCGETILTRANPPWGMTYYWQTSPGGISKANSSRTYKMTSPGTRYLRAYNGTAWSTGRRVTVSKVYKKPAVPIITADKSYVCNNTLVTFSESGAKYNSIWTFQGVSGNKTGESASYTVTKNNRTASLTVVNGPCSTSAVPKTITYNDIPPTPEITANKNFVCNNDEITFTASNTGNSSIQWRFEGTPGTKSGTTANYVVTNTKNTVYLKTINGNCSSTEINKPIEWYEQPEVPTITADKSYVCNNTLVTFSESGAKYNSVWEFENIPGSRTGESASYTVTKNNRTASLTVVNGRCSTSAEPKSISYNDIPPTPEITANKDFVCNNGEVTFTASNTGNSSIQWRFEGTPGTKSGTTANYVVTNTKNTGYLKTINGNCSSTEVNKPIEWYEQPEVPTITADKSYVCNNTLVTFSESGAKYNSVWEFENIPGSRTGESASYTVTKNNRTASLTVVNGRCSTSAEPKSISYNDIPPTPEITANKEFVCNNGEVTFTASNTGSFPFQWRFEGTSGIKSTTTANYIVSKTKNTAYLKTINGNCSSTEVNKPIEWYEQPEVPTITADKSYVYNNTLVTFSESGAKYNSVWEFENILGSRTGESASYTVTKDNRTASLTVVNGRCSTSAEPMTIIWSDVPFEEKPILTSSENYIHTITPQEPYSINTFEDIIVNENVVLGDNSYVDVSDINHHIIYFDGLGRPKQEIITQAATEYKDIVQLITYDQVGRRTKEYLPFNYLKEVNTERYHGAIVKNPIEEQQAFYNTPFPGEGIYANTETDFEPSPLNRASEIGSPGDAWKIDRINGRSTQEGHTQKYEYGANLIYEVKKWNYSLNINSDTDEEYLTFNTSGTYPVNSLYLTITKNENWTPDDGDLHTTHEFIDKLGNTVLRRNFVENEEGGIDNVDTYYVFNERNLLVGVIPPKASQLSEQGAYHTFSTETDQLCYWYKYDEKKRMVLKKLPGAANVKMLYDKRNRLVATQDGNMREENSNKWLFIKYDELNRQIMTGWVIDPTLKEKLDSQSIFGENTGNVLDLYTNESVPMVSKNNSNTETPITSGDLLTINYYDNYNAIPSSNFEYEAPGNDLFGSSQLNNFEVTKSESTIGYTTIIKEKNLNTGEWITTVSYFDEYGRIIQTIANNQLNGFDRISMKYNWRGELLSTITQHTIHENTADYNEVIEGQYFIYDHAGSLLTSYHQIAGQEPVLLTSNKYNKLRQLESKELHNSIQEVDYKYNIRGWLTDINNPDNIGDDLFAMQLAYNLPSKINAALDSEAQFNGNISAISWKNSTASAKKAYAYTYDKLNRLTKAQYGTCNNGPWTAQNNYSVDNITYDLNGNIKTLQRYGVSNTALIDNLTYEYLDGNNSNQLAYVSDAGNVNKGFKDEANQGNDYDYDPNGNLKTDQNKNASDILYNYLNLPRSISLNGYTTTYTYNAVGKKLEHFDAFNNKTTKYIGNFVYENTGSGDMLVYIITPEGRIVVNGTNYAYEYNLKDHLGNTRIVMNEAGEAIQKSDYYPFGMRHEPIINLGTDNTYLYNNKELQEDWNVYDYGRRMYDPALGRWHVLDPMAESYAYASPYNYVLNNPITNLDGEGYFVLPEKFQRDYPELADYLKNTIQGITSNSKIMTNLMFYGDLSRQQITEDVAWDNGPEIDFRSLPSVYSTEESIGRYSVKEPNTLQINKSLLDNITNAQNDEELQTALFFIAVEILHEYVHYGDYKKDGKFKDKSWSECAGTAFEKYTYGQDIDSKEDADNVRNGKKGKDNSKSNSNQSGDSRDDSRSSNRKSDQSYSQEFLDWWYSE